MRAKSERKNLASAVEVDTRRAFRGETSAVVHQRSCLAYDGVLRDYWLFHLRRGRILLTIMTLDS